MGLLDAISHAKHGLFHLILTTTLRKLVLLRPFLSEEPGGYIFLNVPESVL